MSMNTVRKGLKIPNKMNAIANHVEIVWQGYSFWSSTWEKDCLFVFKIFASI